MELVYLWVEKYKNIKGQGFNFSPRFECEFKDEYEKDADGKEKLKDNCELIINPKEHLENFFGENINVTAIVGENGSGKSSLFEIIDSIFEMKSSVTNFIFITLVDNILSYRSNFDIKTTLKEYSNYSLQHYLYLANEQTIERSFYSENSDNFQHRILLNENLIANMLCNKYISSLEFKLTSFMYIPKTIEVKPILEDLIKNFTSNHELSFSHFDLVSDENLTDRQEEKRYKDIRNQQFAKEDNLNSLFYESNLDEYHRFLVLWYIREANYDDDNDYLLEDKQFLIHEFESSESFLNESDFFEYFQEKVISTDSLTGELKLVYFKYYKDYFEFDFIDKEQRRYKNLSHGEQTIFGQLLNMYFYLQQNDKPTIFLLDEPDLSLHPVWQQKYIFELISTFSKIKKNIHFIITSHSPFMLSDLPKENVIFLEKGKQVDADINPFGANIHTLLSHGFFMKDGLMGEFAKGKIEDLINYLNDKESKIQNNDEAQKLLNIIGEPIIKNQLQKMLDSKRLSKIDKVDFIEQQIIELQKELEQVKNDKH